MTKRQNEDEKHFSCKYVKDDHPNPEELFCFKFDRNVMSEVKCQQDSDFAPQLVTGGQIEGIEMILIVQMTLRQIAASVLSLNETEGEELLGISQAFPPPPEGEVVDFCVGDCALDVLVSEVSEISTFFDSF